jgi:two-component system, chemotaxis family, CheB/CheR fusion protein
MAKKKASARSKASRGKGSVKKSAAEKSSVTAVPAAEEVLRSQESGTSGETGGLGFPVVGIGASAGGLEALETLLDHMPADTGMAFVAVTHQHPGHTSLLPELLARDTEMPVIEAADGVKIKPNHVYVSPPGGDLAILNGTLHRMETDDQEKPHLPIDYFFRSLAQDLKERAICIVLSGNGTDGTIGLKAVKGEVGMAMVQKPQSARYPGMPASAIATGLADFVLTPAEMPEQLVAYIGGPYLVPSGIRAVDAPASSPEPMQKIFLLLRNRTGHDFSDYKQSTIRRRIERRMNVHLIDTPDRYVRYLQNNPHEIDQLFKELLISVTCFFRDPGSFQALVAGPLSELFKSHPDNYTLRVWVPGCATGEEVFTYAIVLRECMETLGKHFDVQLFGTDLDDAAIDSARTGEYPSGIGVDVSPERLEQYFIKDESTYRIRKDIREMAIFAPQNVIKDPPFTKLDILSCRNLLIYLNADLQQRLLPIFHYALKPGGLLILGPSESIGHFTDLFEVVDKKWKIFRRKETAVTGSLIPEMPASAPYRDPSESAQQKTARKSTEHQISTLIERRLLARFCPACVVVNDRGDIIHVHGRTGEYLELPEGQMRNNVLDMAREGLPHELSAIIRQATANDEEIVRQGLKVRTNGGYSLVDIAACRFLDPEPIRGLTLITFCSTPLATELVPPDSKKRRVQQVKERDEELEQHLQFMQESHQTTLEELETSNEELQSTNEELQSTNEELETSKEEMQSLNEELTTVNAELQSKVEDLSQANDDMQNLLNSTQIATVFLDNELNIKRYTDQATSVVMLRKTDVGRPIAELASNLENVSLTEKCREVLRTLVFLEEEVTSTDGSLYLMRIMPYRTSESMIDGVVITFVTIDQLQMSRQSLVSQSYFEAIVNTIREPLVVLDASLRVVSCNRRFYQEFETNPSQTEGALLFELNSVQWDVSELRRLLEEILPQKTNVENFQLSASITHGGRRSFIINARRLTQAPGVSDMILLVFDKFDTAT